MSAKFEITIITIETLVIIGITIKLFLMNNWIMLIGCSLYEDQLEKKAISLIRSLRLMTKPPRFEGLEAIWSEVTGDFSKTEAAFQRLRQNPDLLEKLIEYFDKEYPNQRVIDQLTR